MNTVLSRGAAILPNHGKTFWCVGRGRFLKCRTSTAWPQLRKCQQYQPDNRPNIKLRRLPLVAKPSRLVEHLRAAQDTSAYRCAAE